MKFTDENGNVWETAKFLPGDGYVTQIVPVEPEEEKPWPQAGDKYWYWGYYENAATFGRCINNDAMKRRLEANMVFDSREACEAAHRVDVARATLKRIQQKYLIDSYTSAWAFRHGKWSLWAPHFPEVTYFPKEPTDTDKAEIERCLRVIAAGGVDNG